MPSKEQDGQAQTLGSLEEQTELWHFLKVAKSDWSRHDVARVLSKLKAIGVSDIGELLRRVNKNTINDELEKVGRGCFSRETIESIRKCGPFVRSLEAVHEPSVRQIGAFAPVPALFSTKRLPYNLARHGHHSHKQPGKDPEQNLVNGKESSWKRRYQQGNQEHVDRTQLRTSPRLLGQDVLPEPSGWAKGGRRRSRSGEASLASTSRSGQSQRLRYLQDRGRRHTAMYGSVASLPDIHFRANATDGFRGGLPLMGGHGQEGTSASSHHAADSGDHGRKPAVAANAGHEENSATKQPSFVPRRASRGFTQSFGGPSNLALDLEVSYEEMERLHQVGNTMRSQPLEARWLAGSTKSPLQQGEEMLAEQAGLEERARFFRELDNTARGHLVRNIRTRLKEEESYSRDSSKFLNIEHRCTNIRKNLSAMVNARRELAGMRSRLLEMEDREEHSFLKGCDIMRTIKSTRDDAGGERQGNTDGGTKRPHSKEKRHHSKEKRLQMPSPGEPWRSGRRNSARRGSLLQRSLSPNVGGDAAIIRREVSVG